jgi:hypothetical protein
VRGAEVAPYGVSIVTSSTSSRKVEKPDPPKTPTSAPGTGQSLELLDDPELDGPELDKSSGSGGVDDGPVGVVPVAVGRPWSPSWLGAALLLLLFLLPDRLSFL